MSSSPLAEPTEPSSSLEMSAAATFAYKPLKQRIWLILGALAVALPTMIEVGRLSWATEAGAHGPIVLATGLWLVFRQWPKVQAVAQPARLWLVAPLFISLLAVYVLSSVTQIVEVQGYVMYAMVVTLLWSEIGTNALSKIAFPLLYFLFMFPPPDTLVAALTQPLKILISQTTTGFLSALGYPIGYSGVTIQVGQYQLLVAQACSGLNSIISLSAISLFYVYVRHRINFAYAAVMMLAILPVAIFANFIRVLILILLTYHVGEAAAQGFLHDFAGITMFMTALMMIVLIDKLAAPLFGRLFPRFNDGS